MGTHGSAAPYHMEKVITDLFKVFATLQKDLLVRINSNPSICKNRIGGNHCKSDLDIPVTIILLDPDI